jgi:hypothetical protein
MPQVELEGRPLAIFPCRADKTPACPRGFYAAVTGRDRIEDLFRRYPGALVGAPTGSASGIDVLDIDRSGEDWLATYEATHGLPSTRIVATRSGGLHIYFQHRVGMKCSAGLLASNVDIRSTGGYVILWDQAGCKVLCDAPIAPWPGPMLQLLHEATEAKQKAAPLSSMGVASEADPDPTPTPHRAFIPRTSRLRTQLCKARTCQRLLGAARVLCRLASPQ